MYRLHDNTSVDILGCLALIPRTGAFSFSCFVSKVNKIA
jgi:hypothetical protein